MNTEIDKRRMYIETIMNRLRQHYIERTPLPGQEGAEQVALPDQPREALSLQLLQRLYRHVISEGYGE